MPIIESLNRTKILEKVAGTTDDFRALKLAADQVLMVDTTIYAPNTTAEDAINSKMRSLAILNPVELVPVFGDDPTEGICTWTISHTFGEDVICIVKQVTGQQVQCDIVYADNEITVSISSDVNIPAETYKAIIMG
jgi:hypothetical protein